MKKALFCAAILLEGFSFGGDFCGMENPKELILGAAGLYESVEEPNSIMALFSRMESDEAEKIEAALEELGEEISDNFRYAVLGTLSPETEVVLGGNELDDVLSWFNRQLRENGPE